ncbi:hypothetical protein K501DRAFT_326629 [Backusella circina FSU 941]|nr:hypothetical protein K501DRAFT_326629 [Backusella circina FSU 941]
MKKKYTQYNESLSQEPPLKIRKKPGRKPNPASPALRKAQNRAAQRAFRERKEKHMRELEVAIKQVREQRDKLHTENQEMKAEAEIMRSENWYLKGIVLTLQLVCFQHNLVIPQHGPYINEQALSVLAQSIPKSISAYINVNASNKLPIPQKLFGYKNSIKQRDRFLSTGSIVITKEGIHSVPDVNISKSDVGSVHQTNFPEPVNDMCNVAPSTDDLVHPLESDPTIPPLSPVPENLDSDNNQLPRPVMLTNEPITSNLAAIQALRLRLRLQSACVRMDALPFAIQPTILQLTIPHDPRIDLIPTPHMRDRMILFRDQFDLDDCFRCLLGNSVFHGGDPAIAGNWQLPSEFFEKYWFLTIDYDLRRTTNKWRRLQGLSELDFKEQQDEKIKTETTTGDNQQPALEPSNLDLNDISSLLGLDFWKIAQQNNTPLHTTQQTSSYASSLSSSDGSYNSPETISSPMYEESPDETTEDDAVSSFEPVRLTDGYSLPYVRPKKATHHKTRRHHPYLSDRLSSTHNTLETCDPWDTFIVDSQKDCDSMMESLIDIEQTS